MISIVIPVYNEEKALPATLRAVFSQPGEFEVIVVDGGSNDATRAVVADFTRAKWLSAPKGRASQMNAGAAAACGEWLLFLHADTLLPENALNLIADANADAGGFRHQFSGSDWRLKLISCLDNWRCRRTCVFYGDQAMIVRRSLFCELGGFPSVPILEDVRFCEKLVQKTRPVLLDATVVTDARKFLQMGIARSFLRVFAIMLSDTLHLPIPAQRFFSDIR